MCMGYLFEQFVSLFWIIVFYLKCGCILFLCLLLNTDRLQQVYVTGGTRQFKMQVKFPSDLIV